MSPPGVENERRFGRVGEVEEDPVPLNHTTGDIAPFDIKKTMPRGRLAKAIRRPGRLTAVNYLWNLKLVGRGRAAEQTSQYQAQRRDIGDREMGQ